MVDPSQRLPAQGFPAIEGQNFQKFPSAQPQKALESIPLSDASLAGRLFAQLFPKPDKPTTHPLFPAQTTTTHNPDKTHITLAKGLLKDITPLLDQTRSLTKADSIDIVVDLSLVLITVFPQLKRENFCSNLISDIERNGINKSFLEIALNLLDKAAAYGEQTAVILLLTLINRANPAIADLIAKKLDIKEYQLSSPQLRYWFIVNFVGPQFFPEIIFHTDKIVEQLVQKAHPKPHKIKKPSIDFDKLKADFNLNPDQLQNLKLTLKMEQLPSLRDFEPVFDLNKVKATDFGLAMAQDYLKPFTQTASGQRIDPIDKIIATATNYKLYKGILRLMNSFPMRHNPPPSLQNNPPQNRWALPSNFSTKVDGALSQGVLTGKNRGQSQKSQVLLLKDVAFSRPTHGVFFGEGLLLIEGTNDFYRNYYTIQESDLACPTTCPAIKLDNLLKPLRKQAITKIQNHVDDVVLTYRAKLFDIEERVSLGKTEIQFWQDRNNSERTRTDLLATMPGYFTQTILAESHQKLDKAIAALVPATQLARQATENIAQQRQDIIQALAQATQLSLAWNQHNQLQPTPHKQPRTSCFENNGQVITDCPLPLSQKVLELQDTVESFIDFIDSGSVYDETSFYQHLGESASLVETSKSLLDTLVSEIKQALQNARETVRRYREKLVTIEGKIQDGEHKIYNYDTQLDHAVDQLEQLRLITGHNLHDVLNELDKSIVVILKTRNQARAKLTQARTNVSDTKDQISQSVGMDQSMQKVLDQVAAIPATVRNLKPSPQPAKSSPTLKELLDHFTIPIDNGKVYPQHLFLEDTQKADQHFAKITQGIADMIAKVEQSTRAFRLTVDHMASKIEQKRQTLHQEQKSLQTLTGTIDSFAKSPLKGHLEGIYQTLSSSVKQMAESIPISLARLDEVEAQLSPIQTALDTNWQIAKRVAAIEAKPIDFNSPLPETLPPQHPLYPVRDFDYNFDDWIQQSSTVYSRTLSRIDKQIIEAFTDLSYATIQTQENEDAIIRLPAEQKAETEEVEKQITDYTREYQEIEQQVLNQEASVKHLAGEASKKRSLWEVNKRSLTREKREKRTLDGELGRENPELKRRKAKTKEAKEEVEKIESEIKTAREAASKAAAEERSTRKAFEQAGQEHSIVVGYGDVKNHAEKVQLAEQKLAAAARDYEKAKKDKESADRGLKDKEDALTKAEEKKKTASKSQKEQQKKVDEIVEKVDKKEAAVTRAKRAVKNSHDDLVRTERRYNREKATLERFRDNKERKVGQIRERETYLSQIPARYQEKDRQLRSDGQKQFGNRYEQNFRNSYNFLKTSDTQFKQARVNYHKKDGRLAYHLMLEEFASAKQNLADLEKQGFLAHLFGNNLSKGFRQAYQGNLKGARQAVLAIEERLASYPHFEKFTATPGITYGNLPQTSRFATPEMLDFLAKLGRSFKEISRHDKVPQGTTIRITDNAMRQLYVSDLSYEHGGRHPKHKTHRDGKAVDLGGHRFDATNKKGLYDAERTSQVIIEAFKHGAKRILYGDKALVKKLQSRYPHQIKYDEDHADHLHIEIK